MLLQQKNSFMRDRPYLNLKGNQKKVPKKKKKGTKKRSCTSEILSSRVREDR